MRRLYRITLTPPQAWVALALAIAFETFATLSTKASRGFTVPGASAAALVGFALTTVLLAKVLEVIPTSIAYSIWTGLGSVVVTVLGVLIFGDHLTVRSAVGVLLVVGGVLVLNRPVRSAED